MRTILLAVLLGAASCGSASGWGPEGHSIIAEIAQPRLTARAAALIAGLLDGRSLASVASWADDVREQRKGTSAWHFVDIPIAVGAYDPAVECKLTQQGDCIVAELERLKTELRCAESQAEKIEALKFAVHFVGDIHQPLHTVEEAQGGNQIAVAVYLKGTVCSQACRTPQPSNFHAAWDVDLIRATVWNWGAYLDRLEGGWLKSAEAQQNGIDGGTPADWAVETHKAAQAVWQLLPANHVIDDAYYRQALPVLDRQLGVAGLRLARFLNDAYASNACPVRP
jgi:hypothetical protein